MKDTPFQAAPAPAVALTDSDRPTTVRWRIFLILLLLAAINYIDRASLSVALPLISADTLAEAAAAAVAARPRKAA